LVEGVTDFSMGFRASVDCLVEVIKSRTCIANLQSEYMTAQVWHTVSVFILSCYARATSGSRRLHTRAWRPDLFRATAHIITEAIQWSSDLLILVGNGRLISSAWIAQIPSPHCHRTKLCNMLFNYISATELVMAYPRLTFRGIGNLTGQTADSVVCKYVSRGFVFWLFDSVDPQCKVGRHGSTVQGLYCPHSLRTTTNSGMLKVNFAASRSFLLRPRICQTEVIWRYGGRVCGGNCGRVSYSVLLSS
jgi:hypothetical protein